MKYNFLPDRATLAAMVDAFRGKLQDSYRKLLTTIHEETGYKQAKTILENIEALPRKNFSSILTFYYHHTVRAINEGEEDIPKLLSDLDRVLSFVKEEGNNGLFIVYEAMPDTIAHAILRTMGHSITNYNIALRGLPQTEELKAKQRLEQGVKYLQHNCPKALVSVQELVHQIFFVGSDCPENHYTLALTGVVTQGMVFINAEKNTDWVSLLDKYVHEAAPAYLFLINQEELLVLNDPKRLYPSPVRHDMRPMEGVYHAVFVLMRLLYTFSMILEDSSLVESDKKDIVSLIKTYSDSLEKGYDTVMEQGELTQVARILLEEGYESIHAFSRAEK